MDWELVARVLTGAVAVLGGVAGVYATTAGTRAAHASRSIEARRQEWAEVLETSRVAGLRAAECEARERELRGVVDELRDEVASVSESNRNLERIIRQAGLA
jgi:hypothetical protein